jgi:hypothetical protein
MKKEEAINTVALMAGLIVGSLTMRALGLTGIWQILGTLAVGIGFGALASVLQQRGKSPQLPPPGAGPQGFQPAFGPCPLCGNPRVGLFCSRCGTETGPARGERAREDRG